MHECKAGPAQVASTSSTRRIVLKLAFALEYSLGHTTHAENLKASISALPDVEPVYVDIPYRDTPVPSPWTQVKLVRDNWSVRASLAARYGLRQARDVDAAFFHSQVTSLFSAGYMRRIPSIVSLDATPLQYDRLGAVYGHEVGDSRLEALKKAVNIRAFRSAKRLVTWSAWAKGSLVDEYGIPAGKITVIPPGIDLARWRFERKPPSAATLRVLFVGGDFERKGGPPLVDALRRCRDKGLAITADIVSKSAGSYSREEGVRVHDGLAPNSPELRRLFEEADIFVLPTRGDCLPLVILEALASGLPVVSTDAGAIPEAVTDAVEGRIVPPDRPELLASAIGDLAADPAARGRMSERSREKAERRFSAKSNYGQLVDLLIATASEGRA